ncbi:MAG TPA: AMP-binding protein [Spirochaetota bacterium]|nr:AMP-binding protein [Spirochaetota bacterium]HPI89353.1 AMP-binding protein [Spirochaetota bacterium]HPR48302.1 AMP-binding protein [Spirochaetota bacterium]
MGKPRMAFNIVKSLAIFAAREFRRGTLSKNFRGLKNMEIKEEMSWAELLEEKVRKHPDRLFLTFEGTDYTYRDMDNNANRTANYFLDLQGGQGTGAAMLMENSPAFLDVFIGLQKIGMYTVPVNTSLKGDSLLYVLNHCEAKFLVLDEAYIPAIEKIRAGLTNITTLIVNTESPDAPVPEGMISIHRARSRPTARPSTGYRKDDICFITYTSGTTGLPKGVVYRYRNIPVKLLSLVAHMLYRKSDILYTAMKLFHGNALFVTVTCGMHTGARVVLARKFSASGFWDEIRKHRVTSFNTIGAMIPILMKQPESPLDNKNNVRFILSAACPTDLWKKFEDRYGLTIYEAYGAVDGGGKVILNLGTAPVGSIGKPPMKVRYRLLDSAGNDVPDGTPGELIFASGGGGGGSVEYFRNEEASREKSDSGWVNTGDLMKRDSRGYLYFVGRNTESMRIKGENVSAFQVEQAIQKHPSVLEAAVYAVPSELAEDEIMASVSLVEGRSLAEEDLLEFIKEDLPKFAVPRYIRIVREFPKTETFRIKKKEIEEQGVAIGTYDAVAEARIS